MTKKSITFTALGIILTTSSAFFWLSAAEFFKNPTNAILLISFAVSLASFLTLVALFTILNDTPRISFIIFLATSLMVLFFFPFTLLTFLASIGLLLALLFFSYKVQKTKNLFIKVEISRLLGHPLRTLFTLLAVILSLAYYDFAAKKAGEFQLKIPDKVFNTAAESFLNLLEEELKGPEQSFKARELAEEAFERQIPELRQALLNQGVTSPDELEKEIAKLRSRYLSQVQQQVQQELKSPTGRNEKILDYLKENVNAQLNAFISRYRQYIPLILVSSFFFTFEFFGMIVRALSLFLAWSLFELLKRVGVVRVETITKEVETITL